MLCERLKSMLVLRGGEENGSCSWIPPLVVRRLALTTTKLSGNVGEHSCIGVDDRYSAQFSSSNPLVPSETVACFMMKHLTHQQAYIQCLWGHWDIVCGWSKPRDGFRNLVSRVRR